MTIPEGITDKLYLRNIKLLSLIFTTITNCMASSRINTNMQKIFKGFLMKFLSGFEYRILLIFNLRILKFIFWKDTNPEL